MVSCSVWWCLVVSGGCLGGVLGVGEGCLGVRWCFVGV